MDLTEKIRQRQASVVYDRLDLVPSANRPEVEKYINRVRAAPYSETIIGVFPMPNAHISRSDGQLRGVVYVTDGTTPATAIINTKDLGGGVSIYKLSNIDRGTEDMQKYIASKMVSIRDANGFCDASLSLDSLVFDGPSLGDINCSWGIFKSIINEELDESWHLVVRSYHAPSSKALYDLMKNRPEITIKEVFESKEHLACISNSDTARNALANSIVKHLNARLAGALSQVSMGNKPYTSATPLEVNRYNVIQRIMQFGPSRIPAYAYYFGCYGFAETRPKMVIYGMDRSKGYLALGYNSKIPQEFGVNEYGYGFPMGSPPSFQEAVQRKADSFLRWGSSMVYHPKSLAGINSSNFHESSEGGASLRTLGYSRDGMGHLSLVKKGLYISSPDPRSMTVQEIVDWSGPDVTIIAIPKDHDFIHNNLMAGYRCLYNKNRNLKFIGDIIKNENEHVFFMHVTIVKQILEACKI